MRDYTNFCKWALVWMIDRSTQDDKRSKIEVEALFSSPAQIEDNYKIQNSHIKRYILRVEDLEAFEKYYNCIQSGELPELPADQIAKFNYILNF